jgi:hypothetical protein
MNPEFYSLLYVVALAVQEREARGIGTIWPISQKWWKFHLENEENQ